MSHRKSQAPVVTPSVSWGESSTESTHPAFGQLQLTRMSGHTELYGSEFKHQHVISITLTRSKQVRNLSNNWFFPQEELFKVYMSEAQFASFVTSMGLGGGSPCTIARLPGESVPEIERPPAPASVFEREFQQSIQTALSGLQDALKELDGLKCSDKSKQVLRSKLLHSVGGLANRSKFIADQFGEHMETVVEKAKAEITGFVRHNADATITMDMSRITK